DPVFGHLEEHLIRVVPGMPALIMRWRRQRAGRPRCLPVRLPLQLAAVAARAILLVKRFSLRHQCGVGVISAATPARSPREEKRDHEGGERKRDTDCVRFGHFGSLYLERSRYCDGHRRMDWIGSTQSVNSSALASASNFTIEM